MSAPTALDWADALIGNRGFPIPITQAAEELRRQHRRIAELEAELGVALEALEKSMYPQKAQLEAIAKLKEVRK